MVWGQETELCKTSPETWHLHLVISIRVGDRNRHNSALSMYFHVTLPTSYATGLLIAHSHRAIMS